MKLYSHWRSSTSFRVRAALNLKGFDYEIEPVDLGAGAQGTPAFAQLNPLKGVPALLLDDGTCLTQSLAIIDYLDATRPDPPMLPGDKRARAPVLAAALTIAQEIHPVNNLRVTTYLEREMGQRPESLHKWTLHWMHEGLVAFQAQIAPDARYCFGDSPDMADLCLAGQMLNARRWGLDMAPFPRLAEIDARLREVDAIHRALPEFQPDAET